MNGTLHDYFENKRVYNIVNVLMKMYAKATIMIFTNYQLHQLLFPTICENARANKSITISYTYVFIINIFYN